MGILDRVRIIHTTLLDFMRVVVFANNTVNRLPPFSFALLNSSVWVLLRPPGYAVVESD